MSYILDALKRSESERRQEALPDPLNPPTLGIRRRQSRPVWPWITATLLIAVTASAGTWWWVSRHAPDTSPVAGQPTGQQASEGPARPIGQASAPVPGTALTPKPALQAVPPAVTPAPASVERRAPAVSGPVQPVPAGAPVRMPVTQDAPLLIEPGKAPRYLVEETAPQAAPQADHRPTTEASAGAASEQAVPRLTDLPVSFQRRVPNLTFNSHIYSPDPARSRVMINNQYLRTGQRIAGMRIDAITENGVIFNLDGTRFEVPVVRDWITPR